MMAGNHSYFMLRAIELARQGMESNSGGPFGAVVVKAGEIIGEGSNLVTSTNDPTAHAEIVAVRNACQKLGTFQLDGSVIYTSCEPCPMCLAAIYWARPERIFFGCTREDAARINFDDDFLYGELNKPIKERELPMSSLMREESLKVFQNWTEKADKTIY